MFGSAIARFVNVNFRFSCPASARRRLASARALSMSGSNPASRFSSSSVAAHGEPGRCVAPTAFTEIARDNACAPERRSIARLSARRTRASSNGARSTLKATTIEMTFRKGRPFAAYLRLNGPRGGAARTKRITPSLLVDLDSAGRALGVEIVAFDDATVGRINEVLRSVGESELSDAELAPLRAA